MKEGVNLVLQKCFVLASHSPPGQRRWNGAGVALPEGSAAPGGARIANVLSYWPVSKHIHSGILHLVQKNIYTQICTLFVTAHGSRLTTLSAELQSSSSASTKSCFKSARPPCRRSLGRQIDSRRPPEQGPPETREMLANRVALTCLPTDRSATRLRFRSDDPSLPHAPVARLRSCSDQVRPVHGWLLEAKVLGLGGIRRR